MCSGEFLKLLYRPLVFLRRWETSDSRQQLIKTVCLRGDFQDRISNDNYTNKTSGRRKVLTCHRWESWKIDSNQKVIDLLCLQQQSSMFILIIGELQ